MPKSKPSPQSKVEPLPPRTVRWIMAALVAAALLGVAIRIVVSLIAPAAPSGSAWNIHLFYQLNASHSGAAISLAPPVDTRAAHLYSQQVELDGLRLVRSKGQTGNNRRIQTVARRAGRVSLSADFLVRLMPQTSKPAKAHKTELTPAERSRDLAEEKGIDPDAPIVESALAGLQKSSKPDTGAVLPDRIFTYVRSAVSFNAKQGASTATGALQTGTGNNLGRARAMIALCRAARIPARLVTGFVLQPQNRPAPTHWVDVYQEQRWQAYDPDHGFRQHLPESYVAFSLGEPLLISGDSQISAADYDVSEQDIPATAAGDVTSNPAAILNLSRLPLLTRTTLATLMLLPLCALLNAVVRTVVGVQTYGTFSPAMLALAAIYVNWLTAAVIFIVVAVIAIFGRSMLPGLKLTRSPRLTIVFTLVALAMALAISIMAFFDLQTGAQVILLPIVILTTLVDRIYSVADTEGLRIAMIRLLWTGITAAGCFMLLLNESLGAWLLEYPELQLITIALVVLLTRYRGPTLLDRPALRWLGEAGKSE